jgi:serine/threonine protein kinase
MFEDEYLDRPVPPHHSHAPPHASSAAHDEPFMVKDPATQRYLLYGRYLMIRQLGKGTYSKVILAKDLHAAATPLVDQGGVVAIKIFRGQRNYDDAFEDECKILDAISQPIAVETKNSNASGGHGHRSGGTHHSFAVSSSNGEVLSGALLDGSRAFSKLLASVRHRVHRAIIFPALGISLLEILQHRKAYFVARRKDEEQRRCAASTLAAAPYEKFRRGGVPLFVVRSIGYQLFAFLYYIQGRGVVHTDLKPENILLEQKKLLISNSLGPLPVTSGIKVIDFGSAEFTAEFKNQTSDGSRISFRTIQTRHYRAPEVVFGSGWSYPADVWSVGLILWELLKGDCVFMTHDDKEHLAMMQRFLGAPSRNDGGYWSIFRRGDKREEFVSRRHHSGGTLRWPTEETSSHDVKYLKEIVSLEDELHEYGADREFRCFVDLVRGILEWNPERRLSASDALAHPFFSSS